MVTLIINVALFPLKFSSLRSARKMQRLQPQIKAINAKFQEHQINDPKKAEQNQEVMALYKKEGVNPVGRMSAALDSDAVPLCFLSRVEHCDRTAARALALGERSFRAGDDCHSHFAGGSGGYTIPFPKADAVRREWIRISKR